MSSHATQDALERAKKVLTHLEEQATSYSSLELPVQIAIELDDQRKLVQEMEETLITPPTEITPDTRQTIPLAGSGTAESQPLASHLKNSIVAVLDKSGHFVGTGFIVDKRLALTCSHVITTAGSEVGHNVWLSFEVDQSVGRARIDPDAWSSHENDDVVVLRMENDAPQGAVPLELKSPENSIGHTFHTFGYPRLATIKGLGGRGTIIEIIKTNQGRRLLQIESNQIDSGFSGAPVWDQELLKVVGMVRTALNPTTSGRLEDINLAVPADILLDYLPELSDQTIAALANPFYAGGAVPAEMFVGRKDTLRLIQTRLGGRSPQSVSIVGERRMGKSSLLRYVCENVDRLFPGSNVIVISLDLMKAYTQTRRGLMSALRQDLKRALHYEAWEAKADGDLTELSFALEKLVQNGVRLILCLDEIERLTERKEEFDGLLEELRAAASMGQIGMLTASGRPLADLAMSSGLTSPFYNIFIQETLGLLKESEWRELVQRYMPEVTEEGLRAIQRLAGGHPFYTQLVAGRLWEARHAGGETDWQARALEDIEPHWTGRWRHLKPEELAALYYVAGLSNLKPADNLIKDLSRRGLIRDDKLFSEAFAEWMQCQN